MKRPLATLVVVALSQSPPGAASADAPQASVLTGHTSAIQALAFTADGRLLASGSSDTTVKLWDVRKRSLRATLTGHTGTVDCVAFSPHGKLLASGSDDGAVEFWDVRAAKELAGLRGHTKGVLCVAFSPDGRTLASCGRDGNLILWDVKARRQRLTLTLAVSVCSLAFTPDGKSVIAGASDGVIRVWSVSAGERRRELRGHQNTVTSLTLTADGKTLVSGSFDKTARLWDVATGKPVGVLAGRQGGVLWVDVGGKADLLVVAAWKGFTLWDARRRREWVAVNSEGADLTYCAVMSRDGTWLASCGMSHDVKLWRLKDLLRRPTTGPGSEP